MAPLSSLTARETACNAFARATATYSQSSAVLALLFRSNASFYSSARDRSASMIFCASSRKRFKRKRNELSETQRIFTHVVRIIQEVDHGCT